MTEYFVSSNFFLSATGRVPIEKRSTLELLSAMAKRLDICINVKLHWFSIPFGDNLASIRSSLVELTDSGTSAGSRQLSSNQ